MNALQEAKLNRSSSDIKKRIREMTTGYGMTRKQAKRILNKTVPDTIFINELYVVSVFKNESNDFGVDVPVWHLSIRRQDREACHDWRHFQQIKNEICGPEYEGLELYPAESRVLDAANQYHLYVIMIKDVPVPVGYTDINNNGRDERNIGNSQQRPFDN
jgi:hypothetical protein